MRKIVKILPLLVGILSLSSCRFEDYFATVSEISIEDYRAGYQTSHIFDEKNELNITATLTNGATKKLEYKDVTVKLSKGQDSSKAFDSEGVYTVSVSYKNVTSNSVDITVSDSPIYVSGITLEASSDEIELYDSAEVTFEVSPTNYNVDLEITSSSDSLSFKKTNRNVFTVTCDDVKGSETEEVTFSVSGASTSESKVTTSCAFTLKYVCKKVEIKQTYNELSKRYAYTNSICPTSGNVKLLVIPIWFDDSYKYIPLDKRDNVRADIQTAYFGDTGWESVSSFYQQESEGKLNLTGTVTNWYEPGYDISDYGTDTDTADKTGRLVSEAATWYFDNNPSDSRENYDSNNDGLLDGVIAIYGAPDYTAVSSSESKEYHNNYTNLWAYCASTSVGSEAKPNTRVFFWASYDFMYDSNKAASRTSKSYSSGDCSHLKIDTHTYIHEMGHMFGLQDYYDYSKQYCPAGGFSMQDFNVGGHDPFSLISLGWTSPYLPVKSTKIKIYDYQTNHDCILLTPNWNEYDSAFDEYLLVELYTPTGLNEFDSKYSYLNRYPSGSNVPGIRLWHVDARLTHKISTNTYSTDLHSNVYAYDSNLEAFSNSFIDSSLGARSVHLSPLVTSNRSTYVYAEYNMLHLVRNNKHASSQGDYTDFLSSGSLFKKGDEFSMSEYASQFYQNGKLNSGKSLNWSFSVDEINKDSKGYYAVIELSYLG